jgi:small subunit ribosomal protein S6
MIYEIMYIIPSKFSDSEIEGVTKTVAGLFEKHGAKVEKTENLGKIKFAYTIKKVTHGTYILAFIEAVGDAVAKIDQELRLSDEVLRHITIKRPDGIPETSFNLSAYVAPLNPEGKRTRPAKTEAPKSTIQPKISPKASLGEKELDKKLDEILDDDKVTETL